MRRGLFDDVMDDPFNLRKSLTRGPSGVHVRAHSVVPERPSDPCAAMDALGIEPRAPPSRPLAGEENPVVQAKRAIVPELDRDGRDPESGPIWRARHLADQKPGGLRCNRFFEREAAFERARLLARPGTDAAVAALSTVASPALSASAAAVGSGKASSNRGMTSAPKAAEQVSTTTNQMTDRVAIRPALA